MKKKSSGEVVYSPSDLVRYLASPFASWMHRYYLESPGAVTPDEATEDETLIAQTGEAHERVVIEDFKSSAATVRKETWSYGCANSSRPLTAWTSGS